MRKGEDQWEAKMGVSRSWWSTISRLKGGWVLVRMKKDRSGGKRTNWLLIEHRDAAARDGDGDALITDPRSIASGRSLDAIAAGKTTK